MSTMCINTKYKVITTLKYELLHCFLFCHLILMWCGIFMSQWKTIQSVNKDKKLSNCPINMCFSVIMQYMHNFFISLYFCVCFVSLGIFHCYTISGWLPSSGTVSCPLLFPSFRVFVEALLFLPTLTVEGPVTELNE